VSRHDPNPNSFPVLVPLPGLEALSSAPPRPDSRIALARALRPESVGINPEDYVDITSEMLELAAPASLRGSLIDVSAKSSGAIGYPSQQSERVVYVAVTPQEYSFLNVNVLRLGESAVEGSVRKRQASPRPSEANAAAAARAGIHAVNNRAAKMQQYLGNELLPQFTLIEEFQEAARHAGWARFGNETEMLKQVDYLRTYVFGGMLQAIAGQRHWTPAQQRLAERTVEARIFLDRDHNRHITNFAGMLALAKEWNGHKQALVGFRLWQSKKYTKEHGADV